MKKPKGITSIAPPPRRAPAMPATETVKSGALVPVNVRLTEDAASYLRLLSAKTRTPQRELVERAIDLLRAEAGEV